jgi:Leucine-rich repeat (LRR) protein
MKIRRFLLMTALSILLPVALLSQGCKNHNSETPPPPSQEDAPVEKPVEETADPTSDDIPSGEKIPETFEDMAQSLAEGLFMAMELQAVVEAASGQIIFDESEKLAGVDLASDRVSADNETVGSVLKFTFLKTLRLACNGVSNDRIVAIKNFDQLEELYLQDATISDADLCEMLSGLPHLKRLTLRRLNSVSDEGIKSISSMPDLEVLALIEMNVTGTGIQQAAAIPRLRSLDLRNCGSLTADELADLPSFESLGELKLGGPTIDDAVMNILIEMPALKSISIEDAQITEAGIQALTSDVDLAARMRSLTFARTYGFGDETLTSIGSMQSLETLVLKDCYVTGSFLEALSEAVDGKPLPLKTLVLIGAFPDEQAMAALPAFAPTLVRLDLTRSAIMASSMAQIGQLTELSSLTLSECGLNDEGLAEIATLSKLTTLNISKNFEISNASTAVIEGLPALQNVISTETGIVQ